MFLTVGENEHNLAHYLTCLTLSEYMPRTPDHLLYSG
jgi:hypothetical protein